MLIPESELRYDWKGASFDLSSPDDRSLLGWIFNQFLYGEVTGIQCGHWLYRAPHLNAAAFLAKQAGEELSHVRRILRILSLLGELPAPAHPVIRFLATGMMGGSWGEHVALEMALGEGLVLGVFYAMADTIPDPEIRRIIESAAVEEQRHVEFGERETEDWLRAHPGSRRLLLGQALVQSIALARLKRFVIRKLRARAGGENHPVLGQFESFYDHSLRQFQRRIEALGLSAEPLDRMSWLRKLSCVTMIPIRRVAWKLTGAKSRRLTSSYLEDPVLRAEFQRLPPS